MQRYAARRAAGCRVFLAAAVALLAATVDLRAQDGAARAIVEPETGLSSLNRLLRRYDFEERERVPVDMPEHFYRVLSRTPGMNRPGFPAFGELGLTDDAVHEGKWSFKFSLDGGSMAAALPTSVLTILPFSDYRVTVWVRTEGLTHARARVIARLYDKHGEPIDKAVFSCKPLKTFGAWELVTIDVLGEFEEAVDLVVELQLVQPRQYVTRARPQELMLEDVSGSAWFDDLAIWRLPRVEFAPAGDRPIAMLGTPIELDSRVRDLAADHLTASLEVVDIDGNVILFEPMPVPRGPTGRRIAVTPEKAGWYRATFRVQAGESIVAQQVIDLAVLPPREGPLPDGGARFGAVVHDAPLDRLAPVPPLLRELEATAAIVPAWDRTITAAEALDRFVGIRDFVDALLAGQVDVIVSIGSVPDEIAETLGLDHHQVLDLLAGPPAAWRPYLQDLFLTFGQRIQKWMIGSPDDDSLFLRPDLEETTSRATKAIGELAPHPIIYLPWTMTQAPRMVSTAGGYTVRVPYHVPPESLPAYIEPWMSGGRQIAVALETLPEEMVGEHDRIVDAMLRTLWTFRADAETILIDAPWTWHVGRREALAPTPMFPVWRELTRRLAGRHFAGELALADGVRAWILQGHESSALVVWNESAPPGEAIIREMLGAQPVTLVDAFGNQQISPLVDGRHVIEAGAMPLFVEDVDLELARFRAAFAIEPDFLPSAHRVHEQEIVLENPWPVMISGRVRLVAPEPWDFKPRVIPFTIPSGASTRIPVAITFGRQELSGEKRIIADVELTAETGYRFRMADVVRVGMENIQLSATWHLARNVETGSVDLIVVETVTNIGPEAVIVEAYAQAPGTIRITRRIDLLEPGESAMRTFRFEDGAARLSGKTLRLGVRDAEGSGQLNSQLRLPPLDQ